MKRLYDTLSSFSNQDSGGVLLFGIDEKAGFQVVGVQDLQDLQKKVTEQCSQMEPPVRAVFTVAELNGRQICSAQIPVFENRRNEFAVILYNQSAAVSDVITERSEKTDEPDLLTFCKTPRFRQEIASYLGIKTVFYAMSHYIQPILQSGQLTMTIPESPKSRKQKFYTVC